MFAAFPKVCRWIEADSDPSTLDWRRRRIGAWRWRWGGAAVLAICLALPSVFAAVQADDGVFLDFPMDAEEKLDQKLDNPLANLITVPIRSKFDYGGARTLNVVLNAEFAPPYVDCVCGKFS